MSDPNSTYLDQLANFIGDDGDTTYSKEIGGTVTFYGTSEIDSDSALFDGTTDCVANFAGGTALKYLSDGQQSWTVELIVNARIQQTGFVLCNYGNAGTGNLQGFSLKVEPSAVGTGMIAIARVQQYDEDPAAEIESGDDAVMPGVDTLISIRYELGTGITLFTEGFSHGTSSDLSFPTNATAGPMYLGGFGGVNFDGRVKNLRMYEGFAKEDEDITDDPVLPFPGLPIAVATAPFICNPVRVVGYSDLSNVVTGRTVRYAMQLTGSTPIAIPISLWQATLATDTATYVQCFIPNVDDYIAELEARLAAGERFVIYRVLSLTTGSTAQVAVADSPIQLTTIKRVPSGRSCLLAGYGDSLTAPQSPVTYDLSGIRSVSQSATGLMRVRCNIDWLMKPGDIADTGDQTFTVTYITYYTNQNESYMDLGER